MACIILGNYSATHLLIPGPGIVLPVLHEYITEGAVEDCIEEVCNAEVEDEDVGDCSHLVVPCAQTSHVWTFEILKNCSYSSVNLTSSRRTADFHYTMNTNYYTNI